MSGGAIGDAVGWAHVGEEFLDPVLAGARKDDEAGAVGMMEPPGPPGLLSDPRAGLGRSEDGGGEQPDADQARLAGERLPAVVEHVDQRTFADVEADEVGEQARQPLERDRVGEAQIERKGPQVATERRAWLQARRRQTPGLSNYDFRDVVRRPHRGTGIYASK